MVSFINYTEQTILSEQKWPFNDNSSKISKSIAKMDFGIEDNEILSAIE